MHTSQGTPLVDKGKVKENENKPKKMLVLPLHLPK